MNSTATRDRQRRQTLRTLAEKHPWLLAYAPLNSAPTAAGGRPPAAFPRRGYSCRMSAGEIKLLELWQKRLGQLIGRPLSRGETAGLLAGLVEQQFLAVSPDKELPDSFDDLMDLLLRSAYEKKQRLRKLAEAYPYIGMYAASLAQSGPSHTRSATAARRNYSLRLTRGEASVIDGWEQRFERLFPEKPQRGETVGLLAWIATAQYEEAIKKSSSAPTTLEELLAALEIGN